MAEERTLYGFWLSPYMSQVAHILIESELSYQYVRVSPFQGSTHSPEHKERNPLGKIPTLTDVNGVHVSESQAICRYLARTYPEAMTLYPVDDPVRCAEVDTKNDFITFSIGGPYFNCFVFGAYFPKAFGLRTEEESRIFSTTSLFLVKGSIYRLLEGASMSPFLLGEDPCLADFQFFHTLEVSRTFSKLFEMPQLNLVEGAPSVQAFHEAMTERKSTRQILEFQAQEFEDAKRELFEEFGPAYRNMINRDALKMVFGHEV